MIVNITDGEIHKENMSKFKTLYEDEHLLAVEKPGGLLTVASKPKQPNLLEFVQNEYSKKNIRLRPIHRLDKDTSGIVVFCKTKQCFNEAVIEGKFANSKKTYWAVLRGAPKIREGEIKFPLSSRENKKIKVPCTTKYKVIKIHKNGAATSSLVEAEITSGKFHQIRQHMTMIHHPLLMDRDYMDRGEYKYFQKLVTLRHYLLHEHKLEFKHFITGKPLTITCDPPEEFKKYL